MALLKTLLNPMRISAISLISILTACGGGEGPGNGGSNNGPFIGDTRPNVSCEPESLKTLDQNFIVDGINVLNFSLQGGLQFTSDTILESACYITSNQLEIPDNVTLTISPNTIFMFRGASAGLSVFGGNIIANGTATNPIYFTGEGDNPIKWAGIRILSRSLSDNIFNYTVIEHAGSGTFLTAKAAFSVIHRNRDTNTLKGRITFTNNVIRKTSHNAKYAFLAQHHSFFNKISNNTIYDNPVDPISITANEVHFIDGDNKFQFGGITNLQNNIVITNSIISSNEILNTSTSPEANFATDILWQKQQIPYLIEDNIQVTNITLNIEAGAELQFIENSGLTITGENTALSAKGTSLQKIKFTVADQNVRRGQTIEWIGLQFLNSASTRNVLDHTEIFYGGGDNLNKSNLTLTLNSQVKVSNSKIQHSQNGYGIQIDNTSRFSKFSNNKVSDNTKGAGLVAVQALSSLDPTTDYSGNFNDYIEVNTKIGNVNNFSATIPGINVPYVFFNDFIVRINLSIEPGAELLFAQETAMEISGGVLTAQGSPSQPIIFGSFEQSLNGNTNSFWDGLLFYSSGSILEYVTIQHAGFNNQQNNGHAGIRVISSSNPTRLQINNLTIKDLDLNAHPIYVDAGSSLLIDNLNSLNFDVNSICRESQGDICK